ncbi:MAG: 3-mercaptopyruvate sulfurtransferase [Gemmatimonadales bacterium]
MTITLPVPLVSTDWLAEQLGRPGLVVLDASWYLPQMNRDPLHEYRAGHIPGALFWDLDAMSDASSGLPHMLPEPAVAADRIGALGIGNEDAVVVYDGSGVNLSAPRAWWHFRALGHERVAVLDGGMARWRAQGRPEQAGDEFRPPTSFHAEWQPRLVRSIEQVRAAVGSRALGMVDARSAGRFEGREPEPRAGLAGGHIPGAKNLPFAQLVDSAGQLLPPVELRARFEAVGVDLAKPVIATCGSGVSAAALALGLEVAGHRDYAVYDGSWTEWGGRSDTPIETGPA